MINTGKFKHKIKIIKFSSDKVDGFITNKKEVIHTARASVQTTKGYTIIKNGTDFAKASVNFTIRYTKKEITTDMYVDYKDTLYKINYVNNINLESNFIELQATTHKRS